MIADCFIDVDEGSRTPWFAEGDWWYSCLWGAQEGELENYGGDRQVESYESWSFLFLVWKLILSSWDYFLWFVTCWCLCVVVDRKQKKADHWGGPVHRGEIEGAWWRERGVEDVPAAGQAKEILRVHDLWEGTSGCKAEAWRGWTSCSLLNLPGFEEF